MESHTLYGLKVAPEEIESIYYLVMGKSQVRLQ